MLAGHTRVPCSSGRSEGCKRHAGCSQGPTPKPPRVVLLQCPWSSSPFHLPQRSAPIGLHPLCQPAHKHPSCPPHPPANVLLQDDGRCQRSPAPPTCSVVALLPPQPAGTRRMRCQGVAGGPSQPPAHLPLLPTEAPARAAASAPRPRITQTDVPGPSPGPQQPPMKRHNTRQAPADHVQRMQPLQRSRVGRAGRSRQPGRPAGSLPAAHACHPAPLVAPTHIKRHAACAYTVHQNLQAHARPCGAARPVIWPPTPSPTAVQAMSKLQSAFRIKVPAPLHLGPRPLPCWWHAARAPGMGAWCGHVCCHAPSASLRVPRPCGRAPGASSPPLSVQLCAADCEHQSWLEDAQTGSTSLAARCGSATTVSPTATAALGRAANLAAGQPEPTPSQVPAGWQGIGAAPACPSCPSEVGQGVDG